MICDKCVSSSIERAKNIISPRRCRFQEKLSARLDSDNSLHDLAGEYHKVKRFAKERNAVITKYKPFYKIDRRYIINRPCKSYANNIRKI